MKDLPIVVKEVLESEDLKNIKRVDGIKETSEALIGALNYIPVVGGGLASELQQIKMLGNLIWKWILQKVSCFNLWGSRYSTQKYCFFP